MGEENLSVVPVLADAAESNHAPRANSPSANDSIGGEARGSTNLSRAGQQEQDSRGGGQAPLTMADLERAWALLHDGTGQPSILEDMDRMVESLATYYQLQWRATAVPPLVRSRHQDYLPLRLWDETLP